MMPLTQIDDIYHILNSWHLRAENEFTMEVSKPALNNLKLFFPASGQKQPQLF